MNEIIAVKLVALPSRDRIQFISSFTERAERHLKPDEEEKAKQRLRKGMGFVPMGEADGKAGISY